MMNTRKATAASARKRSGRAVKAVAQDTRRVPKLPHERDESTDAMAGAPRKRIKQAHDDLRRGLTDTDRGPAVDTTYRKLKQS